MKTIKLDIAALKSERSKPETGSYSPSQLYQMSMLEEMKNSRAQLHDIKDLLMEYKTTTLSVVAAIQEKKEACEKPVIMPENFMHASSIPKSKQQRQQQTKRAETLSTGIEQKLEKRPSTEDCGKHNDKNEKRPVLRQQTEKSGPVLASTGLNDVAVGAIEKVQSENHARRHVTEKNLNLHSLRTKNHI